jgi:hypothetical protein
MPSNPTRLARVINIRDAQIKTVQVGIKAITISDKQVTLAVFRQLFEEDLIAHDGTLNGLPWGREFEESELEVDVRAPRHTYQNQIRGNRAALARQLDKEIAAELQRRERCKRTIAELANLPQLFIAV